MGPEIGKQYCVLDAKFFSPGVFTGNAVDAYTQGNSVVRVSNVFLCASNAFICSAHTLVHARG